MAPLQDITRSTMHILSSVGLFHSISVTYTICQSTCGSFYYISRSSHCICQVSSCRATICFQDHHRGASPYYCYFEHRPRCVILTIPVCICIIVDIVIETIRNQRRSVTLPDERYRAIKWAERFLQDLQDPSKTPRVPKRVRMEARAVLRHYPGTYYIEELARRAPDIITAEMEDLTRFIKQGEQQQDN